MLLLRTIFCSDEKKINIGGVTGSASYWPDLQTINIIFVATKRWMACYDLGLICFKFSE